MDGWRRVWDLAGSVCEVAMLLALACLGLLLLPCFCIVQAFKGDPWWFLPHKSPPRRGGYWDHP